jgi:hypothetical protein
VLDINLVLDGRLIKENEPSIAQGIELAVSIHLRLSKRVENGELNLVIRDGAMAPVITLPLYKIREGKTLSSPGDYLLEIELGKVELNGGKYSFVVYMRDSKSGINLGRVEGVCPFQVVASSHYYSRIVRPVVGQLSALESITSKSES